MQTQSCPYKNIPHSPACLHSCIIYTQVWTCSSADPVRPSQSQSERYTHSPSAEAETPTHTHSNHSQTDRQSNSYFHIIHKNGSCLAYGTISLYLSRSEKYRRVDIRRLKRPVSECALSWEGEAKERLSGITGAERQQFNFQGRCTESLKNSIRTAWLCSGHLQLGNQTSLLKHVPTGTTDKTTLTAGVTVPCLCCVSDNWGLYTNGYFLTEVAWDKPVGPNQIKDPGLHLENRLGPL